MNNELLIQSLTVSCDPDIVEKSDKNNPNT